MKNIGKSILAAAIIVVLSLQAHTQSSTSTTKPSDKQQTTTNLTPGAFIDKNNNGVCDNFESRSVKGQGVNFIDNNGDGICDNLNSRQGTGRGANFVDKNGDGICDNRASIGKKPANYCRYSQGNQQRNGQGRGPGKCWRR